MSDSPPVPFVTLCSLAVRDLLHERLPSVCLVVALAGLVAPLLILFALKSGVIETLRSRLVEDPIYRELHPLETRNYARAFFDEIRSLPETEFIVESVMKGASVIRLQGDADRSAFVDMLPSAPGDPLLAESGIEAPEADGIVISHPVAAALGVSVGSSLELIAERSDGGRRRTAAARMQVQGVLPLRADAIARVYVPLGFALDVESFREGLSVPDRDWIGDESLVEPRYHGVVLALEHDPGAAERSRLLTNTGFFIVDDLSPERYAERFGEEPPDAVRLLDVRVVDRTAPASSVERLRGRLRGRLLEARPYVEGVQIAIADASDDWRWFPVISTPGVGDDELILPDELSGVAGAGDMVALQAETTSGMIDFSARVVEGRSGDAVRLSSRTSGILSRATERGLAFDEQTRRFKLEPLGYRAFRLFARSIDDVEALGQALEERGVSTRSSIQEILRLQALDRGLGSLFSVIVTLGIVTGIIVLLASQYAAVERRRTALAHLRLMGLSRRDVALMPLVQGIILALLGAALGTLLTYLVSGAVNTWLASPLGFEGDISVIRPSVPALTLLAVTVLSIIASIGAAWRTTGIDPAEGMRDE